MIKIDAPVDLKCDSCERPIYTRESVFVRELGDALAFCSVDCVSAHAVREAMEAEARAKVVP